MDLIDAMASFRASQNVAENTAEHYMVAVRSLIAFGIETTQHLTRANLAAWVTARRKSDVSIVTINSQLGGILSVASALEREGRFPLQRLQGLRRLRIRGVAPPEPRFLSRGDVSRLRLEALTVNEECDLAISLAIFAGLRLNELRRLHVEDMVLDVESPYIKVLRTRGETKTRRSRVAPIARAYAKSLRERGLDPGPVFPSMSSSTKGLYMGRETFRDWLRRAREGAELFHVTWFVLRHTFASYLRQGGVGLDLVSGFMGNTRVVCEKFYAAMGPGGNEAIEKGFLDMSSPQNPEAA